MNFYKLSFYIKAENLDDAYKQLLERMQHGGFPDTEQLITEEQFEALT